MKQMTCPVAGGPADCDYVLTGNTFEEMMENGMQHVTEAHPEMAAAMQNMSKEDTENFLAEFHGKFDALPEASA
jgi:predicted small metal-binding protein